VRQVRIRKKFPHTLFLSIEERKAFGLLPDKPPMVLDREGVLFPSYKVRPNLPVIEGL